MNYCFLWFNVIEDENITVEKHLATRETNCLEALINITYDNNIYPIKKPRYVGA